MPFRLWNFFALPGWAKVDTGECARLVQVMVPQVGHTSIWRPGERVLDVLARGGKIPPGTAIATLRSTKGQLSTPMGVCRGSS
jgi:hypothetical protein